MILKGVRQCGKSHALETFGQTAFERYFMLNFEESPNLHQVFEKDLNPKRIIEELAFYLDTDINPERYLIVFDEIQACPKALTSLKYFSEKMPELALCAAGSLLGLELTPESFPVGKVDFLTLHPMSFDEFLLALNDNKSLKLIRSLAPSSEIPDLAHQHLWERFKWFCVTGGLPEVVQTFVTTRKDLFSAFQQVREKQNALILSYYSDIAKHAGKENAMHIERIFRSVPAQLSRTQNSQAPRFQFSNIIPGIDRYQRLAGAIDWLAKVSNFTFSQDMAIFRWHFNHILVKSELKLSRTYNGDVFLGTSLPGLCMASVHR